MRRLVSPRSAFLFGVFAMLFASLLALVVRASTPTQTLPDLVEDRFTELVPIALFSAALDRMKFAAKPSLYFGILVGQLVSGGLIALGYAALLRWRGTDSLSDVDAFSATRLRRGLLLTAALVGVIELLLLPVAGAGLLGLARRPALDLSFHVVVLVQAAVYSTLLLLLLVRRAEQVSESAINGTSVPRRAFIANIAMVTGGIALWGLAVKAFVFKPVPQLGLKDEEGMQAEVTPNADFYTVSKNFANPEIDVSEWRLQIGGLVERPRSFALNEILALPNTVEQYGTLECISNEVGGDLISNGLWKGVRLADLLRDAGVKPAAKRLVLTAADGYTDSFPMERALHPEVLLAYQLNGATLPKDHGFPVRLVVPGIFGMKNVKWITKIELSDNEHYMGFWELRGWSNDAFVKTMSRIDVPKDGAQRKAGPQHIGGVAFSGDRGIKRVEVSTDAGKTWRDALLKDPRGPYTWVIWLYDWNPTPGSYDLLVRCTDNTGVPQIETVADTVPDGASGYHHVQVTVA